LNSNELNARRAAISILRAWQKQKNRISAELNQQLKRSSLSQDDRRLVTELVNGAIRMQGRLDWELAKIYRGNYSKLDPEVRLILLLAAHQIKFINRVPDYAAVSTAVELAKAINQSAGKLVNGVLRNYIRTSFVKPSAEKLQDYYAWMSHPQWLVEKWIRQWSLEKVSALTDWNNTIPALWVRINELDFTQSEFEEYCKLHRLEIEQFADIPRFYKVKEISKLLNSPLFPEGKLSVQDPAGGLVIRLLQPRKDDVIADGCSAPGGKTSYIAECLGNNGSVQAFDSDGDRLAKVAESAKRLGLENITLQQKDLGRQSIPATDKLLLDVPCSGTGVMAKRSDLRWRRNLGQILKLSELQFKILNNAAKYVNPAGVLVYSTCSLEPEENWQIIDRFLADNKNFRIEPAQSLLPEKYCDGKGALFTFPPVHKIDGGFAVRLRKE